MKTKKVKTEKDDNGKSQAIAQVKSIVNMVNAYEDPEKSHEERDAAIQTIQEDALSVEVRSGWVQPGNNEMEAEEFQILLCAGGPAVRLCGDLDEYKQPKNVRVEYQDWGTPWTEYPASSLDLEKVLTYAQQFYFGE